MALVDASGTVAGVATVQGGTPALNIPLGGSSAGGSTTSGAAAVNMGSGSISISGTSTVSSSTALAMVAAITIAGAATVEGDVNPQGAGTINGLAVVSGTATVLVGLDGTLEGLSTLSGTSAGNFISTAQVAGQGTLSADLTTTASGTINGTSSVSQPDTIRVREFTGRIYGTSRLLWSAPRPIHGKTILSAFVVVETIAPAIKAIVAPPKCFRYLQLLQRGDLPIYISDRAGPVSPFRVTFTMFQVRPNGTKFQVGPAHRTPAAGVVGEYYVTGHAGEQGQPGDWIVRWEYQRSFDGAFQTKEMEFRVLDAVLANDPRDVTVRVQKYGWN